MKRKLIFTSMLVLVLVAAALVSFKVESAAPQATQVQRITFNFDHRDGMGWGWAFSAIPPWSWTNARATFDGNLLTKGANQDITTLTGTLTLNSGAPNEETFTTQLKPTTLTTFQSGPWPGCDVVCHDTYTPTQLKYQGEGSNVRDGAGSLWWTTVTNLPVAPTTRQSASFSGMVVSKDQAINLFMWDRGTPTIE